MGAHAAYPPLRVRRQLTVASRWRTRWAPAPRRVGRRQTGHRRLGAGRYSPKNEPSGATMKSSVSGKIADHPRPSSTATMTLR